MAQPVEAEGGALDLEIAPGSELRVTLGDQTLPPLRAGAVMVLRDSRYGADVRRLFLGLLQIEPAEELLLNGVPIEHYRRDSLRQAIAYVDPAHDFFEGTLMQNLTSFQPKRHQRRALFWSFLSGLDAKVRSLPLGYGTAMGDVPSSGLSSDAVKLAQVVRALATDPQLLLLDLSGCSYGKNFIDGLQRILKRTRGRTSVWISGGGRVLDAISDDQLALPALAEVTR